MRAVAARYSGGFDPPSPDPTLPPVKALQVWNEPNLSGNLSPQFEGTTAISPVYYREMLNVSYGAVKAVAPRMLVVTAGTAPYGDPPAACECARWCSGNDALREGREEDKGRS
jgi:hypothetical protein